MGPSAPFWLCGCDGGRCACWTWEITCQIPNEAKARWGREQQRGIGCQGFTKNTSASDATVEDTFQIPNGANALACLGKEQTQRDWEQMATGDAPVLGMPGST